MNTLIIEFIINSPKIEIMSHLMNEKDLHGPGVPRGCVPTNHISVFCMELCVSGRFHVKYTYMIGREHSHIVLPDYINISF